MGLSCCFTLLVWSSDGNVAIVRCRQSFQALGRPLRTTTLSNTGPVVATTDRQPL